MPFCRHFKFHELPSRIGSYRSEALKRFSWQTYVHSRPGRRAAPFVRRFGTRRVKQIALNHQIFNANLVNTIHAEDLRQMANST